MQQQKQELVNKGNGEDSGSNLEGEGIINNAIPLDVSKARK